jgi:hypothetical protein
MLFLVIATTEDAEETQRKNKSQGSFQNGVILHPDLGTFGALWRVQGSSSRPATPSSERRACRGPRCCHPIKRKARLSGTPVLSQVSGNGVISAYVSLPGPSK